MAKKAEDILKSQGLTDADITAMAPLLSDARYRAAIETSFNALESERDALVAKDHEWEELRNNTYVPALTKAEKQAADARLELAQANEKLRIAKDYGYLDDDAQRKADEAAERVRNTQQNSGPGGFNPDDPKFKSFSSDYSRAQGDAIALHDFISEEYRLLHGSSINEYRNAQGQRGLVALRAESQAAGKRIDQYVEEKFNWSGKRQEAEQKRQAEHDAKVGREAVNKYALEHPLANGGNPMTAPRMTSRNPFVPDPAKAGKQPWEVNPVELRNQRIERAFKTETKAQLQ
jgi:hypothetical protein